MTEQRAPGRSLVSRRAVLDIIRPAVTNSYGVIGFADSGLRGRFLRALGLGEPGIGLSLRDGIAIDLYLTVAFGLPVAEVARQADSAVRYALRRAVGQEVSRLTVHVGGLRFQPVPARIELPEGEGAGERAVADPPR